MIRVATTTPLTPTLLSRMAVATPRLVDLVHGSNRLSRDKTLVPESLKLFLTGRPFRWFALVEERRVNRSFHSLRTAALVQIATALLIEKGPELSATISAPEGTRSACVRLEFESYAIHIARPWPNIGLPTWTKERSEVSSSMPVRWLVPRHEQFPMRVPESLECFEDKSFPFLFDPKLDPGFYVIDLEVLHRCTELSFAS